MKIHTILKCNVFLLFLLSLTWGQSGFKNLQVLDKNISKDDLKATMNSFSDYLDVKCSFCHILDEYHKDDKEHKRITRNMIQLTQMIRKNGAQYFSKEYKTDEITCYTCHNGSAEIKPYNPDDDWP